MYLSDWGPVNWVSKQRRKTMSLRKTAKRVFRELDARFVGFYVPLKTKIIWKLLPLIKSWGNSPVYRSLRKLSFGEMLIYYTPDWYHDFAILGFKTHQMKHEGAYEAQRDKQTIIFDFIKKAVDFCRKSAHGPEHLTGVELFCADGFYSNFCVQNGVDSMLGIDLAEESGEGTKRASVLDQARVITKLLGNETKIIFERRDVFNLQDEYDICLCLGGLYHLNDPEKLLGLLRKKTRKVLIIQTVVSLEREDEDYFETPCPGWTWGCRFSHQYLLKMLERNGWNIQQTDRNEITWNKRLCDRGSSYVLCTPM